MTNLIIHGTATAKTLVALNLFCGEILDTLEPNTVLPFVATDLLAVRTSGSRHELDEILGFRNEDPATYFPDLSKIDMRPGSPLRNLLEVAGEPDDLDLIQTLLAKATNLHTFIQF